MEKSKSRFIRILSIDGGGIRGIVPGQIVAALEKKLQDYSGNPEARIADHFDLIAGTSTGGILCCIYLCPDLNKTGPTPKFSAVDAVNLYIRRGHQIFDVSLWQKIKSGGGLLDEKYDAQPLETALDEYLGDLKLSQLLKPSLITAYDIKRMKTKFFTSYDAKIDPSQNYFLKDVARATSAAPSFFELPNIYSLTGEDYPLLDGGVFANNPAICAYSEVRHKFPGHPTAKDMLILSLGVGYSKDGYEYETVKNWNFFEWLKPLSAIMRHGVCETVDYQLNQIFDSVNKSDQYFRIEDEITISSSAIDDASEENLQNLKEEGTQIAQKYDSQLNRFVELLSAKPNPVKYFWRKLTDK